MTGLNPLVQFVVAASSLVVAGAATAGYRRVSQFVDTVEQHERLLTGEEGTPDDGLVEDVEEHRQALIYAGIYPYREVTGGRIDEQRGNA